MRFIKRLSAFAAASVLTVGLLGGTVGAAAATNTHKVKIVTKGTYNGNSVKGKVLSSPWGKGTYKGTLNVPEIVAKYKVKGGTFVISAKGTIDGNRASGQWKMSKGTGKFKEISGHGTWVTPNLADGTTTFKGNVKY
jgi:hypothetical protein